ncbi:MAG: FAD-dependent oxidoreductase [Pseudomonadota bacterium]
MQFERGGRKRVAVIGGGIAGLGAAHMLASRHHVTLFEAEPRLGGHARTVTAGRNGNMPVDTGFLVFNHANYPYLTALFHELGVDTELSNMSFGVSIDGGWFEYGTLKWSSIIAQRRNLLRPNGYRLVADILKFNREAPAFAESFDGTISDMVRGLGLGSWFEKYYLYPLSGAIWSTPTRRIGDFPARALIRFFKNHALLGMTGHHDWYTVTGGSRRYVVRIEERLRQSGADLNLGAPIDGIRRTPLGVEVKTRGADWETFDEVILATHSDDSLAMLTDATPAERAALGAITYQPNEAILHRDTRVMPRRKGAWASWVYTEEEGRKDDRIDLTYWINNLQNLPKDDHAFVTLNSARKIPDELIYDQTTFRHPVFDHAALEGQKAVAALNGSHNTWFCGAWMKNGFHEDGLASAVDVVEALLARESARIAAE